jgi:hypothetical protein
MGELLTFTKRPLRQLIKIVLKTMDERGITQSEKAFHEHLAADLRAVLQKSATVTDYDGFCVGYGECVFWIYTGALERTLAEITPVFRGRVFLPGSYYVKVDKDRQDWDVVSLW